jgi:tetratricopeptide (TPR) repeat protein
MIDGTQSEAESNDPTMMTPSESDLEMSDNGEGTLILGLDDPDDDNEFDYMVVKACFEKALTAYGQGDWAGAELLLQRVADDSKAIPADKLRQIGMDSRLMQFRLTICMMQQGKIDDAKPRLLKWVNARNSSNEDKNCTLRRIAMIYLYAEICLCQKKTEDARKYCRRALSLNRNLSGDQNQIINQNASDLLSVIALLQGDILATDVFLEESRKAYENKEKTPDPETSIAQLGFILALESRVNLFPEMDQATLSRRVVILSKHVRELAT